MTLRKAQQGTAVSPGMESGYLTVRWSKERATRLSREDILSHLDGIAILAPLGPRLRRNILARCACSI